MTTSDAFPRRILLATLALGVAVACGPAPVAEVTVTVDPPGGVVADGRTQATVRVLAKDAKGLPIEGLTASLVSTGLKNLWEPGEAEGKTGKDGVFEVKLASTLAGERQLTATVRGDDPKLAPGSGSATVNIFPGPAIATESRFDLNRTEVRADGEDAVVLDVRLKDAYRNPLPATAVTFATPGSNGAVTPAQPGTTDGGGRVQARLTSTVAGEKTITATEAGGLVLTRRILFVAGEPDATRCAVELPPTPTVADGLAVAEITFVVRDTQGNLVPGADVTISADAAQQVVVRGLDAGQTDERGRFTTRISSVLAGTRRIAARIGKQRFTFFATPAFVPGPASPTRSSLTALAATPVADGFGLARVLLSLHDAQGNPIEGASAAFTAPADATPGSAALETDSAGTALFNFASTRSGQRTVTVAVAGLTLETSALFVAGPLDSTTSQLVASPLPIVADGRTAATLVLTAVDGQGNGLPSRSVSLSSPEPGVTFEPSSGETDAEGRFIALLRSKRSGTHRLSAALAGGTVHGEATFVAGPAVAARSSFEITPQPVAAGADATVLVQVRDAEGNPVPANPIRLSITSEGTAQGPDRSGVSDAQGRWSTVFSTTLPAAYGLNARLATGVVLSGRLLVAPAAASRDTTTVSIETDEAIANGTDAITFRVTARDRFSNPIPALPIPFTLTGESNVLVPGLTPTTDSTGVAVLRLSSTRSGIRLYGLTVGPLSYEGSVELVPGPADGQATRVEFRPTSVVADGDTSAAIEVLVRDAQGNPIPGASVALSSPSVTFTPASGVSDDSGTFVSAAVSTVSGSRSIKATLAGGAQASGTAVFTPGPVDAVASTITSSNAPVVANGFQRARIVFTARDADGNVVPGATVGFSTTASDAGLSRTASLTDASGQAVVEATRTVSQPLPLTVQVLGGVAVSSTIPFSPDVPEADTSRLTTDVSSVAADGSSRASFTFLVRDSRLNPIANYRLSPVFEGLSNSVLPATTAATGADGRVTFTIASPVAELKTVRAVIDGVTFSASVTFTAGAPDVAQSSVSIDKTLATANGLDAATVTVTVRDRLGNAVPGSSVVLEVTPGVSLVVQPLSLTTASGVATGKVSAPAGALGVRTIRVRADGFLLLEQVSVEFRAVRTSVARGPTELTAEGRVCRQHPYGTGVNARKVAVDAGNVVYAVVDCGSGTRNIEVWRSLDGAQSFQQGGVTGAATNGSAEYAIAGGAAGEAFLFVVTSSSRIIYRTTNAGVSWTVASAGGAAASPGTGIAVAAADGGPVIGYSTGSQYAVEQPAFGVRSNFTSSSGLYRTLDLFARPGLVLAAYDAFFNPTAGSTQIGTSVPQLVGSGHQGLGVGQTSLGWAFGTSRLWAVPLAATAATRFVRSGLSIVAAAAVPNLVTGPLTLTARATDAGLDDGAFVATVAGPQLFVQYATAVGGAFSATQTLTNTGNASTIPSVAASAESKVAVVTWNEPDGIVRWAVTRFP